MTDPGIIIIGLTGTSRHLRNLGGLTTHVERLVSENPDADTLEVRAATPLRPDVLERLSGLADQNNLVLRFREQG